jgi:hypothetical protein
MLLSLILFFSSEQFEEELIFVSFEHSLESIHFDLVCDPFLSFVLIRTISFALGFRCIYELCF